MKLFYALIDNYGVFVFEAFDHKCAQDHVEDCFPEFHIPKDSVRELDAATLQLEFNSVKLEKLCLE